MDNHFVYDLNFIVAAAGTTFPLNCGIFKPGTIRYMWACVTVICLGDMLYQNR